MSVQRLSLGDTPSPGASQLTPESLRLDPMPVNSYRIVLRENAWQLVMIALGVMLVALWNWPLAGAYLAYALLSNVLFMALVCPYCGHYALGTCRAGFHLLSGQRFRPRPGSTFTRQFRIVVWLMAPGWIAPPLAGLVLLAQDFSWGAACLAGVFCLVAFVILPKDAQRHCRECETRDCPRRPRR